jgi:hypothetical protein
MVAGTTPIAWDTVVDLRIPELHDRLMAAKALARGPPLISNDPAFDGVPGLDRVWYARSN